MNSLARGKRGLAAVLAFHVLFSIVTAYYTAFTGMASYDDEGVLIGWVRNAFAGQPLYDRVSAPYGPLYFAYEWLAHIPLGIPISNDSVRFVTVFFWVTAALLVFLLSYKMTGSILVSWGSSLLAFFDLSYLSSEPAHPQEMCIVLLVGLALAGCFTGHRTRLMLSMGALAAAMALTKINLGIFAIAALSVVFIYSTNRTRLWTAARVVIALVALAVPAGLMSGLFGQPWALRFCALETLSLAAAIFALSRIHSDVRLGIRDFAAAAIGFAASLLLISSFALARGSSLPAMIHWLIVVPRQHFGPVLVTAAPVSKLAIPWAIVCLLLAWSATTRRLNADIVALLKLGLAAIVAIGYLTNHPGAVMSLTPPLLWLVAIRPGSAGADATGNFARAVLLMLTAFEVMYAFPVAGMQVQFTGVCTIAIAAVCLADALRHVEMRWLQARIPARRQVVAVAVSVLLVSVCGFTAWGAIRLYNSRPALNLPGAARIHLNLETTQALRGMVRLAQANACGTLVTLNGMPSFNVWTGLPSPPALGGGKWIVVLNDAEQESIARQLTGDLHTCAIVNTDWADLWATGPDALSGPMARFLRDNFRREGDYGPYKFLVRR